MRTTLYISLLAAVWLSACSRQTKVQTEKAERRTLLATVTESGTIQPDVEVPIAPDISGEVTAIYVKEGDYVQKGQLLFEIRPDNYQAALEQSNASVNSARADMNTADASILSARNQMVQDSINMERQKRLYTDKVISEQDYQQAELRFQLSRASYQSATQSKQAAYYRMLSASASMRQSMDQLQRTRVYASMEGTVTYMKLELGQRVVGTGMMAGTEVIKLADLREMEVKVSVNENEIVNVRVGDTASVEVDAYRGRRFRGRVTEIAYSAEQNAVGTSDQVTNYAVEIRILRESYATDAKLMQGLKVNESPFRPGMSAVVRIYTDKAENVVSVPIQAVTVKRDSKEDKATGLQPTIVYLYEEGKVKARDVKTGLSDESYIEITKGLKAGEKVVTGPFELIEKVLKDGMEAQEEEPKSTNK